ncbi:hypothetical protein [Mesorhizobium sp. WSM3860]|uniref:hypothetical protein n=1 Tax=Mesorhizobium sp. WSM3860 TaxID=2029403 RepID=UPI000BB09204|nr:hypothetical protein [Mesorhizobium sp. WSM3860]PBC01457.1 hypothetical protein CK220_25975 [Mesorhizobium sp. WSM3860]
MVYNDLKTDIINRFWLHMFGRHKGEMLHGKAQPRGARWHDLPGIGCSVSITTAIDFVRVFVRTVDGGKPSKLRERLGRWQVGPGAWRTVEESRRERQVLLQAARAEHER